MYGISSGAFLALEAACRLPNKVTRLALYEPPASLDAAAIRRFQNYRVELDALLAAGRRGEAVTLFMRLVGAGLAEDASAAPHDAGASLRQAPVWPIFASVAPTLAYDAAAMGDSGVPAAQAAALPREALLFLNVTPHSLDHGVLAGTQLVDEVAAAGLAPGRVVLEMTERAVARPWVVAREARRLRALGFRIALDDTGAGNAGLEMLSQMAVDFVKIDRGVVAGAATGAPARAVLAGILAIARETGAYVIAEGIETTDELRLVRRMGEGHANAASGVHGAQGYLLGRPSALLPTRHMLHQHKRTITAA